MKTRFLNPQVEAEVTADPTLWLAWCLKYGTYDDEIDPLHQEAWVAKAASLEACRVTDLKRRVKDAQDEHQALLNQRHETRVYLARTMALEAHGDQRYGKEPYSVHLEAVVKLCEPYGVEAQVLAWLHDALEDTYLRPETIEAAFGPLVLRCCQLMTDPPGQNRRERKLRLYEHLKAIHEGSAFELALVVKAADRLANVQSCVENKSPLLKMYRQENPAFCAAVHRPNVNNSLIDRICQLLEET